MIYKFIAYALCFILWIMQCGLAYLFCGKKKTEAIDYALDSLWDAIKYGGEKE